MKFPFPLDVSVPLYLAPMAGVSESPFRQLCHEHGADVVVTEYGVAELRGHTVSERAKALIAIAHPEFRRDLEIAAAKGLY